MDYMTGLKRAVGTGSARDGTKHHWQMILSSIAMGFAVPVFVLVFGYALGRDHAAVLDYFSNPVIAVLLGAALFVCIRHFMNETLEAIEDYVHGVPGKLVMFATTAVSYLMIAFGLFALAKIAF